RNELKRKVKEMKEQIESHKKELMLLLASQN
ncbi:unnamed protein product, partial [marine sediment metagenome]